MKRYLIPISLLISSTIFAQIPEDALRYSFYPQTGTARVMAIGGAIGSLGGDITSTFVNPAGLGAYKNNEFVLTPGIISNNNKVDYWKTSNQAKKSSFGFGPSGWVWGYASRRKPGSSSAISLAVNQTANFNNTIQYTGLNNQSSYAEQYAEEFAKSGYSIDQALNVNSPLPYTSAVALYTYLIDTVTVNGGVIIKAAPEYILDAGQAIRQTMNRSTTGGLTEIALGIAHNNVGRFYFGGTIGVPILVYNSITDFQEFDTSNNSNNHFKQFDFKDNYSTKGLGINVKFGVIYRPTDNLRLGLAVHSPTFMSLTDTRITNCLTLLENPKGTFEVSSNTFTNGQPGESNYQQITPFKGILSGSYVFGTVENTKQQKGFISADIEYTNHGSTKFIDKNVNQPSGESAYYSQLNSVIKSQYKGTFNFKVGGEMKFNTFMGRLGFAYYGNPYVNAPEKTNRMLLSGGIGYRNQGMFIDLTYVYNITHNIDIPYRLQDRPNYYATLKQMQGNIMATIGFKF